MSTCYFAKGTCEAPVTYSFGRASDQFVCDLHVETARLSQQNLVTMRPLELELEPADDTEPFSRAVPRDF